MESWHRHSSSLRHERSCRKSRPQSERRNSYRNSAKRTTRSMVGLRDGMLLFLAERALQNGRWQDSFREQICQIIWPAVKILWSIGWVHPNNHERYVNSTSFSKDNAERNILRLCATCGARLVRRFDDSRSWRYARIRILRNLRQKIHKPTYFRTSRKRISVCIRVFETS